MGFSRTPPAASRPPSPLGRKRRKGPLIPDLIRDPDGKVARLRIWIPAFAGIVGCGVWTLARQVKALGGDDGLGAVKHAKLSENHRHMGLHRRFGDIHLIGDLFVQTALFQIQ